MSSDIATSKLDEVADVTDSLHKTPKYSSSGYPMVRCVDLLYGPLNLQNTAKVTKEVFDEFSRRYSPKKWDIIITRVGANFGDTSFVDETEFCLGQNTAAIAPRINPRYLYHVLNSSLLRQQMKILVAGAAQPTLSLKAIKNLDIPRFGFKVEDTIASILGGLDDRITLLRETNATLEGIAQAMFKSWFVDFDPVHAKQQGRAPDGMDEATAALFPDMFEESELGLVPTGWGIRKAETLLTRLSTKIRYTKEQVSTSGTIPVYEQGAKILLGYHENSAQFAATPNEPMFIFGDHTCVFHLSCEPFDISMNVIPLKGIDRPTLWTYYAIKDKQTFQEYRRHWMELAVKDVVVAPQEICNQFSLIASALHVKMESNSWQANTLATLRDTLLPRLISGQLRLPEAEALVGEATA